MGLNREEKEFFQELGLRLRKARIEKRETQDGLGARAGISRQLLARMERGEPNVAFGKWIRVSSILGLLDTWSQALIIPADPFAEYDKQQRQLDKLRKTRVRQK